MSDKKNFFVLLWLILISYGCAHGISIKSPDARLDTSERYPIMVGYVISSQDMNK